MQLLSSHFYQQPIDLAKDHSQEIANSIENFIEAIQNYLRSSDLQAMISFRLDLVNNSNEKTSGPYFRRRTLLNSSEEYV